ncbi:MAG: aminotransferase class V-fold PLP-dependent enzyme [Patescibacteria group bacterium]|nr:aminotransferase class V-fold PLP-dependent enzyme [Patescibacteria group bacterium]
MFWKRRVYLDTAAGTNGNSSSPHEEGQRAKKMLEDARTDIARLVEVQSDDVIFTSGATESNALAILGTVTAGDHALYLPSAHASIVENMKLLGERGVVVEALPVTNGRVDCDTLKKTLRPQTRLVSMDAVCGETGTIWNTREVAQVLRKKNKVQPCFLHVDASQAPLTEKITRAHFGADLITLDGSKVSLPGQSEMRGVGALVAHRTIPLQPLYRGGGQERGLRPGSEAPELARAFAAALSATVRNQEAFRASAEVERIKLIKSVMDTIPNLLINECRTRVPNILNLSLPGRDTDYLVALLDEAGFAVSTRSACETDSEIGSRAVLALTGDAERARSTLRISWNSGTSSDDLSRFTKALAKAVAFIDNNGRG